MTTKIASETEWLRSPVIDKSDGVHLYHHISINPYYGYRRKVQLRNSTCVIGSDDECDVVINDPFVSARHCRLSLSERGYIVEDLSSKNGIFLNGLKINRAHLPSQGQLRMGCSVLQWRDPRDSEDFGLPPDWVVASTKMKKILRQLKVVASSNLSVLIRGETGSGKEAIAQLVHHWSSRSSQSYVSLNGGGAGGDLIDSELFGHVKGAFTGAEAARSGALMNANEGSFFLDEVADLPLMTQIKLLRALENGEVKAVGSDKVQRVDVRLITATSQNIDLMMARGDFRKDFYFRIAGHVIEIPPLRDRPEDVQAIAQSWAQRSSLAFTTDALARLLSHSWPGNVRELKNVLQRAQLLLRESVGTSILPEHIVFTAADVRGAFGDEATKALTLQEIERLAILQALERTGWARSAVCRELGIARSTLFEKMRRYQLRDAKSLNH